MNALRGSRFASGKMSSLTALSPFHNRIPSSFPPRTVAHLSSTTMTGEQATNIAITLPDESSKPSLKLNSWSLTSIADDPRLFTSIPKLEPVPIKHGYLVANVTLSGFMPDHLDTVTYFARYMGISAELPVSDPITLRPTIRKWHMNRGPFAHGKTMDVFEKKTFFRLLQVFDTTPEAVKKWVEYIQPSLPSGIDMKVEYFEWKPLSFGESIQIPGDIVPKETHVEQVKRKAEELLKQLSKK